MRGRRSVSSGRSLGSATRPSIEPGGVPGRGGFRVKDQAVVLGVGMVPLATPSRSEPYDVLAAGAARAALADAGLSYEDVQQAYVGYVYGDSTAGQHVLYGLGMTGVPVVNVNNNCSTGSTALFLGRQAVAAGAADVVLVLGFEQMRRGALTAQWPDRPSPFARFDDVLDRELGPGADV